MRSINAKTTNYEMYMNNAKLYYWYNDKITQNA